MHTHTLTLPRSQALIGILDDLEARSIRTCIVGPPKGLLILMPHASISKKLEAELAIAGHPNAFPSTPKTTTTEWNLLQTFDYASQDLDVCIGLY